MTLAPRPLRRLGAAAPGGLALPDAHPTPSHLYAPRGVWWDDERLVVCDSGNHRVLIWHGEPSCDGAPADVVLGQPDFTREGPAAGGRGVRGGLHLPTGVCVADGRLVVADAWHHRVLVWDGVPQASDVLPAWAIGQDGLDAAQPQRGADGAHALGLYWPYGVAWLHGWLWVADTGNRRVLGWRGLPGPRTPPDVVLGQPDLASNDENRGGPAGPHSFRWPHAVAAVGRTLVVADAGDHRCLGWTPWDGEAPIAADAPAALVLGQRDLVTTREVPHVPQGPAALRFPYGVAAGAVDGTPVLAVADTANNRVLLWTDPPAAGAGAPASHVLGQHDFAAAGENRWTAVADDTLCWPYGLALHGDRLAVADSGNNRVMLWTLGARAAAAPRLDAARAVVHDGADDGAGAARALAAVG